MMGWHDGGPGWGGWIVMTLMMLVFWGLLVFGGLALFKGLRRDDDRGRADRGRDAGSEAERILDERFARGEIDADDYRQRRELLRSHT